MEKWRNGNINGTKYKTDRLKSKNGNESLEMRNGTKTDVLKLKDPTLVKSTIGTRKGRDGKQKPSGIFMEERRSLQEHSVCEYIYI